MSFFCVSSEKWHRFSLPLLLSYTRPYHQRRLLAAVPDHLRLKPSPQMRPHSDLGVYVPSAYCIAQTLPRLHHDEPHMRGTPAPISIHSASGCDPAIKSLPASNRTRHAPLGGSTMTASQQHVRLSSRPNSKRAVTTSERQKQSQASLSRKHPLLSTREAVAVLCRSFCNFLARRYVGDAVNVQMDKVREGHWTKL